MEYNIRNVVFICVYHLRESAFYRAHRVALPGYHVFGIIKVSPACLEREDVAPGI